jgi:hypothetical protein
MANIARDEQVIRQTVLTTNAKALDEQVFRQTVLTTNASVRDLQIFRQTILMRGSAADIALICFTAT